MHVGVACCVAVLLCLLPLSPSLQCRFLTPATRHQLQPWVGRVGGAWGRSSRVAWLVLLPWCRAPSPLPTRWCQQLLSRAHGPTGGSRGRRLPLNGGSRHTAAPAARRLPSDGSSRHRAAPTARRLPPHGGSRRAETSIRRFLPPHAHGASHQTADLSNSRCAGFWGSLMSPGARDARLDVNVGHGTLWLRSLPERDSCECCCPRGHGETCSPAILLLNLSRLASQSDLNGSEFCAAHALLGRAAQRRVCCATHNKRCSARTHAQPAASGPTVAVEGHPALPRGQEQWGAFLSGCDGRVQQRCTGVDASGALTQHGQARLARAAFSPGQTSLFS